MSDLERDAQNKEDLADELDRVYLRHMMHQYMQNYGDRLLDEESKLPDTPESHPSASQLRRFKHGLRREAKKSNIPIRKIPRKFVPLVAVMIALLTVSVITAGAHKLNLFSFIRIPSTFWTEYGSRDTFGQAFHFGYIPDGFVESAYEANEDVLQIYYVNNADKNYFFHVSIYRYSQRLFGDSEDFDAIQPTEVNETSAEMNETSAEMIEKDGIISIAWIDSQSGYSYMLSSTLDQNEVMKIAKNISSN